VTYRRIYKPCRPSYIRRTFNPWGARGFILCRKTKAKAARKEYITAFGDAVSHFTSAGTSEALLAEMPGLLVADFNAVRSELWLWDNASGPAYLTHAAGHDAGR
jgi:hypothetical protein